MTKITIVEMQKIDDRELVIGHKVTVAHNGQTREKICVADRLRGDEAENACVIPHERYENTEWIETLPLVSENLKWLHETYEYESFEAFDDDKWDKCQTRDFVWNCEDEM